MSSIEKAIRKARIGLAALQDSVDEALPQGAWATSRSTIYVHNTDPCWPEFRALVKDVLKRRTLGHWRVERVGYYRSDWAPRQRTLYVQLRRDLQTGGAWHCEMELTCILNPKKR